MSTTFKPAGTSRGKVFLGVGHGGSDPGAVKYGHEANMNLISATAAKDYLLAHGFIVEMSRTKDEYDPLTEEIREANASGALCAVDDHKNAGGGNGFEAFYSILSNALGGKLLAQYIEEEVKAIGQNSRGCKTKKNSAGKDYFGFIRQTTMPAVILEGCFVDNATDMKDFDTTAELREYGVAYAKGIIRWLEDTGRVKKASATTKPAPVAKPAVTTAYYKKCKTNETSLVDGLKYIGVASNFATRKAIAKKNGITAYIGTASQNVKLLTLLKAGKLKK